MAPTFQPFNIFGSDDRTVVDDMSVSPYNSIAYLRIRNFYGIAGCRGTATAFAPNAFITSAHMFFDNSTKPKTLVINPTYRPIDLIFNYDGLNSNPPESAMTSYNYNDIDDDFDIEFVFIPASYLSEPTIENFASDYAIVKTTESIFSSYLGFSQNASVDETVTLCGFPEQTSNTSANTVDRRPYESTGEIIQVGTDAFYYLIDASAGQSGAPVFNSSNQILGVHSGGNISSNRACKVDAPLYSMMLAIRNNDL
jgi:glutamyl endopeptidase